MCSRFAAPIGARASASEIGTPADAKHWRNASTGAMQPKSSTVPAQSKIAVVTGPRYVRLYE
jgi:hypothetical protein